MNDEAFEPILRVIEDLPLVGCDHFDDSSEGIFVSLSDWYAECASCYKLGRHRAVGREDLCDLCSEPSDEPLIFAAGISLCAYLVHACWNCWVMWGLSE